MCLCVNVCMCDHERNCMYLCVHVVLDDYVCMCNWNSREAGDFLSVCAPFTSIRCLCAECKALCIIHDLNMYDFLVYNVCGIGCLRVLCV